ncbi:hypothetical protein N7533_002049 [Penicillium manginii]|jgi:hypothetical protein|uniref:uncharacterized protein n=1 Tax=Penicillium manginii TaxID=203109 RepID=UPI002548C45E|nr:uncharacterized protein N7533_002049 [Penicillium manginii]KAJ5763368.1 hypothetical protein N7533_002049 [Penicillium manginii]
MIPGPPALSDGIEPDFEVWKSKIENKLQVNADHISTPELQMAYVFSRCEGPAAQHLAPRMGSDATLRFKNATDMIAHLNTIYGVPSRSDQVFSQYRDVSMEYGQRFIEFFPTFSLLAERAKIPEERRKGDLLRKLSSDLRVRMTGNFQNKSYYELVEICKAMEYHQLNHQDRR